MHRWHELNRSKDDADHKKAEQLAGRIRNLAASGRYFRDTFQPILDDLDRSILANEELRRSNKIKDRLAAATARAQSREYKQARSETAKVESLRRRADFRINVARTSGKRAVKTYAIPGLETQKADTLVQKAFGGATVLTDESRAGISDFCQELVDHMGVDKCRAVLAGIREEIDRNGAKRTGYVAKREFPLHLDASDSELRELGESLVQIYGSKSKGIAKNIERNLLLEQRRNEYLANTSLE